MNVLALLFLLQLQAASYESGEMTPAKWEEWTESCSLYCSVSNVTVEKARGEHPARIHDYKIDEPWIGPSDASFELAFDRKTNSGTPVVTELMIVNGDKKSSRIRTMNVSADGKFIGTVTLRDVAGYQKVKIGRIPLAAGKVTRLQFSVTDVYPGDSSPDTIALTELEVDGTGTH